MGGDKRTRFLHLMAATILAALWLILPTDPSLGGAAMPTPPGPTSASDPFASVFNQQWHVLYRDGNGAIEDSWYDGPAGNWNLQKINAGGLTAGHSAVGNPSAAVFNQQWHVFYRGPAGAVWDSWYDGPNNHWKLQEINMGGVTKGPPTIADPVGVIFNQQMHVVYPDADGTVWDSWYDGPAGHWNLQKINNGGLTQGQRVVGQPTAITFAEQMHVLYPDGDGNIWDSWYDGPGGHWNLQKINAGGVTSGPPVASQPVAAKYNQQMHVLYRGGEGTIWDSWYDGPAGHWNLQKINAEGVTSGPGAVGNPSAAIFNQQWHVVYRGPAGVVWDSWYDGPHSHWNLQKINTGGVTNGPGAAGNPVVSTYVQQMHVLYRDGRGTIWDSWYDGPAGRWNLQKINTGR